MRLRLKTTSNGASLTISVNFVPAICLTILRGTKSVKTAIKVTHSLRQVVPRRAVSHPMSRM